MVGDAMLVVTNTRHISIPTGLPLVDVVHIWVIDNSSGTVNVTNTTAGSLAITGKKAQHLIFVSTVSGANWIPVQ